MKADKNDKTQYRYADTTPSYHPGLTPTVPGNFETEDYVFFWSGPFSNWDSGSFEMDIGYATPANPVRLRTFKFNCSEQAMMVYKALTFNDLETMNKIMETKSPRDQKALGRTVANFDQDVWEKKALSLFPDVLVAKFSQVPGYKKILLDTGDKTLVEASPFDAVWGIRMGVNHPDILNESKWQGKNLLGKCLMTAREIIRTEAE